MKLEDFEVGKIYEITKAEWESPLGDVIPEQTIVKKILDPVSKENSDKDASSYELKKWKEFLRVECPETKKITLLHPKPLARATVIEMKKSS